MLNQRLANLKEMHKKSKEERTSLAQQLKEEKAQVSKLENSSFRLKMKLDELRNMQLSELDRLMKENIELKNVLTSMENKIKQ